MGPSGVTICTIFGAMEGGGGVPPVSGQQVCTISGAVKGGWGGPPPWNDEAPGFLRELNKTVARLVWRVRDGGHGWPAALFRSIPGLLDRGTLRHPKDHENRSHPEARVRTPARQPVGGPALRTNFQGRSLHGGQIPPRPPGCIRAVGSCADAEFPWGKTKGQPHGLARLGVRV